MDGLSDFCTTTINIAPYTGDFVAPALETVNAYCEYTATAPVINHQCNETIEGTTTDTTIFTTPGTYTINWSFTSGSTTVTSPQTIILTDPTTPTNLVADRSEEFTAKISWDAVDPGPFILRYRPTTGPTSSDWIEVLTTNTNVDIAGLNNGTEYEIQVKVDADCAVFTSSLFTTTEVMYCTPTQVGTNTTFNIQNVSIGTIDNTTDNTNPNYEYYNGTATSLNAGGNLSGTITYGGANFNNLSLNIWIDYNIDGDFDDENEYIHNELINVSNATPNIANLSIAIPLNIKSGKTRMRIAVKHNNQPSSSCTLDNQAGEIEDYDVFLEAVDPISFKPAMITQIHAGETERWIEITNHTTENLPANSINLALYKNTSGDQTNVTPSATFTITEEITAKSVFLIKNSSAVLTPTGVITTDDAITDFEGGDDILIISASTFSNAWENRVDVISPIQDNTGYVRNDDVITPNREYEENNWTLFLDDDALERRNLSTGEQASRHAESPTLSLIEDIVDGSDIDYNEYIGTHAFGSVTRSGGNWNNGEPYFSRSVIINQNYIASTTLNTRNLIVNENFKLTNSSGGSSIVVMDELFIGTNAELRLRNGGQLVQLHEGVSNASGSGKLMIEQDSETASVFRYNYFSSPVLTIGENDYSVADVLRDGTNNFTSSSNHQEINFIDDFNGSNSSPISISNEWIYTFASNESNVSNFELKKSTGRIAATDGFTMKGTGVAQNYVFEGTPKDGLLTTTIGADESYLLGNPYTSAIRADQFIEDNLSSTDGTLYFWEHVNEDDATGENGHFASGYQGGYATRNLTMGLAADVVTSNNTEINGTPRIGEGNTYKEPKRYIAIGQGFFVSGNSSGGTITFRNFQREIRKESASNSVFFKAKKNRFINQVNTTSTELELDEMPMLKLGIDFDTDDNLKLHHQLGLSFSENNSLAYEPGFDAVSFNENSTNVSLKIKNDTRNFSILGVPSITNALEIPLEITTDRTNPIDITIDEWQNIDRDVYLLDKETGASYIINNDKATLTLAPGTYTDRFVITFKTTETLSVEEKELRKIIIQSEKDSIEITNAGTSAITKVELFNFIGQRVKTWTNATQTNTLVLNTSALQANLYVLKVSTNKGNVTQKIIIE